jgi:hypothetical protein
MQRPVEAMDQCLAECGKEGFRWTAGCRVIFQQRLSRYCGNMRYALSAFRVFEGLPVTGGASERLDHLSMTKPLSVQVHLKNTFSLREWWSNGLRLFETREIGSRPQLQG